MGSATKSFDVLLKVQKDFLEIVRRSRDLADYCEKHGAQLPVALGGFLTAAGVDFAPTAAVTPHVVADAGVAPYRRPSDIPADWISIPKSAALVYTLVQAVLYAAMAPLKIREIAERVEAMGEKVTEMQVNSIGTRLRKKDIIEYTRDGWVLQDRANTLREIDGRIWGPVVAFNPWEVAAHRREAITWYLRHRGSMTRMDLSNLLENSGLIAPKAREVIYGDIRALVNAGVLKKPASGEPSARLELEPKGPAQLRLATSM